MPSSSTQNQHGKYGLSFHHLGLAVKKPDHAVRFLQALGYQIGEFVFDPLQNVSLAMATHVDQPDVEIIYPSKTPGPLDNLLKKQKDGLVYHLCYTTKDPEASIELMKADGLGILCVSPPKETVLFDKKEASFYIVMNIGLIELIRTP